MDISTIIGFVAGIAVLIYGIMTNGSLISFFDVGSIYITLGGTAAAMLMNFPIKSLKTIIPACRKAFFSKSVSPVKIIDNIVELAEQARKGGLLSLEKAVKEYDDPFLIRGVMTMIDSHDQETVRSVLENEVSCIEDRHIATQTILEKGAAYAPAFGMIGTLVGLINMLKHLDDPDSLGPSMSIALVTTFYGSVLANVIFLPLAGKLKTLDESELLCKQIVIEGILAIQVGENPRLIKEKLLGYLPSKIKSNDLKVGPPKVTNK
ncbi:MAG: MotA/TolQ/ExbB proton channel family protein [Oscillospiraceae bacterium]|nr:MotA/TolQ/ExbB proton channel family protein [Oscillospiraceae bacterium]